MSRADTIRKMLDAQPNDPFAHYGYAMALRGDGRLDEAEVAFAELERRFPDYAPQYLMRFQNLVALERAAEARAFGQRGMAALQRLGNAHALGELQAAIEQAAEQFEWQ